MKKQFILTIASAAIVLGACGTTTVAQSVGQVTTTSAASSGSSAPSTAANSTTTTQVPTVGSILEFSDSTAGKYTVALTKIDDPATPTDPTFGTAPAGQRIVAAEFSITNNGNAVLSDDINNNASVIGSDGQTYQTSFDDVTNCTNFNAGSYTILPHQSQNGCATFEIPNGVSVKNVQFQPNGGLSGSQVGQWNVQ